MSIKIKEGRMNEAPLNNFPQRKKPTSSSMRLFTKEDKPQICTYGTFQKDRFLSV